MTLKRISPRQAKAMLDEGAVLVDVREDGERRRSHIPGSQSMPLSRLGPLSEEARGAEAVIFHCKSGMRTNANAAALAQTANCAAYVLDGGIDAWTAAGLPIERGAAASAARALTAGQMRRVQATLGLLVVLGVALGAAVSPSWLALPAAVAVALLLTGLTGWDAPARLVAGLPWNRGP